jgi:hypothetical protein
MWPLKLLLLAVTSAIVSGQQMYRERVDVSRVLIDVRVLDNDGKPITGLRPADFAVKIDGKAAPVDTLDWVSTEDTARLEARSSLSIDAAPAPHGRWIIFLYQKKPDLSEVEGLTHVRHDLAAFLDIVTPEDRVAVVSLGTTRCWSCRRMRGKGERHIDVTLVRRKGDVIARRRHFAE